MGSLVNLVGKKNNYLSVISFDSKKNGRLYWLCKCDCGNEKVVSGKNFVAGSVKSCGCFHKKQTSIASIKHGKSRSKIYAAWVAIINRCYNKKYYAFHRYGGRGIFMCDKWRLSFESFYIDMGDPPTVNHSIDRIDNNKGYYKENCRWATKKQQALNTSVVKIQVLDGVEMGKREASIKIGIGIKCFDNNIKKGLNCQEISFLSKINKTKLYEKI